MHEWIVQLYNYVQQNLSEAMAMLANAHRKET